jgi:PAS domain S-box-containing protein
MAIGLPDDQIKAFLDAAPDAMVIVDERGTIVFANVETEAMFEYSRAELVGQPIELLLPERFRDRHITHVGGYFVAPRRRPMGAGLELYARRKDGTEFPVEISLSPVTTAHGRFVSSAIRNVTDRKAIERKLIEAREFAEQANTAKSAFLAAASHDLRQPLQTLTLLTSALSRVVPTDSKAATAVANQSEALRVMAELLNALLDISKLEAGTIKPDIKDCSVSRIFARLRREFAVLAEAKGLDLIVEDCNDVVRTDPTLLGQIIQNLLANAIRYTREGWVRLRCVASFHTVRIEVADTGIGIPADELELVFDEYYQTFRNLDEARHGVGLGLSIARRVARLLGCSLDVTSTLGQGSCFTLGVPRVGERVIAASETPKSATSIAAEDGLVLVVDDEVAVADATAMLLGTAGMDVVVATGSQQALEKILAGGRAPGLLICDYHLGRKENGIEAIRRIREATRPSLPTIVVSGDTSTGIVKTLNAVDGCHLLSKPVDAGELLELSARLLSGPTR